MSKPKVSIIVPCYNVAPWVARCMDSLINQTLRDIEIICVDDKSTDDTLRILREYAARDGRIQVVAHDKNMGVAAARNTAMDGAHGEFMGFVDPDDYVDLDFYQKLYETAVARGVDVACGNVMTLDMNTHAVWPGDDILDKISADYREFTSRFWSAVYRTEMLRKNNIGFPVGIITAQDVVFLNDVILAVADVAVCYDTFYYYFYQRIGSLDSHIMSHAKAQSKHRAVCLMLESLARAGISDDEVRFMVANRVIKYLAYDLNTKVFENDDDRRQRFEMLATLVRKYRCGASLHSLMPADVARAVRKNDYDAWRRITDTARVRFYLFGFIPAVAISRYENIVWVRVCGGVPLIKIKDQRKVYLFGIIPVMKWRIRRVME